MKKSVQRITFYICEICETEYEKRKDALECEAKPLEKKAFRLGDIVQNIEKLTCPKINRKYTFNGEVVKTHGPELCDVTDKEIRYDRIPDKLEKHVFVYEVKYECPACKQERQALYNASELVLIHR